MRHEEQNLVETEQGRNGEVTIELQKPIEVLDEVMTRDVSREEPKEELSLSDNSEMWLRRLASLSLRP